jgi:hypothetical protein
MDTVATRDEVAGGATDLDAASFYEGLQLVGWTLVGTSLIAVPWAGKKKVKQQPRDDEFEPAAEDPGRGHQMGRRQGL